MGVHITQTVGQPALLWWELKISHFD